VKQDVERALVIEHRSATTVRAVAVFGAELPVFAGHFPGRPLVPGVLLIEAVRCAMERVHGRAFGIEAVPDARFLLPLLPGERVVIEIAVTAVAGGFRCRAELSGAPGRLAEFELMLRPA